MDFNAPVFLKVGPDGVFSLFSNPPEGDILCG